MIPDRPVVRNVEHVSGYFVSSNAFLKNANNIIDLFPWNTDVSYS